MRNLKVRRLIAMIMTVITVGAQSPLTAYATELTDDTTVAETAADEEETSEEAVTPQISNNEAENSAETDDAAVEENAVQPEETETETVTEGFALTEADFAAKKALRDHNVLEQFASLTEGVDYASNEVFFTADTQEYAEAVAEAYGATLKSYSYGVAVLDLTDSQLSVGQAYAMGVDENVLFPVVEPNYIITLDDPEIDAEAEAKKKNDLLESKITQWDDFGRYDPLLNPPDPNFQWWHQYIDTYGAWGIFSSSGRVNLGSDIKVAVIDSGVTAGHEELIGHTEAKDIGLGVDDGNGHGTHVAGIIGASISNYYGGSGIAPGVQILGYRASDDNGRFMGADTVKAINAAVENGANIINMSLGGPVFTAAEDTALEAAYNAGVTVVAAAGNEAKNGYSYPAAYDHVIAVGASDESGNKTTFSNYGSWVDVMAPGANMRSTYRGGSNNYCNMQGTSQACPVVAGVCALYMSAYGVTSPDEMEQIVKRSTTPCKTKGACASGIINAAKMFDGDATAPQIDVLAEDGKASVATAESGAFATCGTVKGSQKIVFTGKGFNGDEEGNGNTTYYVTVDGSNPNPHDAASSIRYTTAYKTFRVSSSTGAKASAYVGSLLKAYNRENVTETTFTVKAIAVTGRGVISAITSMQITVDPETYYTVDASGGVGTFAQGTSMQLYSSVYADSRWSSARTANGVDQGVRWSIGSNNGCSGTTVSDTGMLTIGANDAGYFTVKCESTAYPDATPDELYFSVAKRAPVASVEVEEETLTQLADEIVIREWGEVTPEIKLKMTLTDGTVLTSDLPNVSWSSSDWWIASGMTQEGKNVVYPRSKGSCTLTGTVLDGSDTKITVNVKVKALIYYFDMTGQSEIAQGKSAKFKAVPMSHTQYELTYGSYRYTSGASKMAKIYGPSDKNFTWSIKDYNGNADIQISGVSVKKGKVKVDSSVTAGTTFSVAATAVEGTNNKVAMGYYPVKVTGASNELLITTDATDPAYNIKVNKKGSVTNVQLFVMDARSSDVNETTITLKATTTNGSRVYWKRNNTNTYWDYIYNYADDGTYSYDPNTIRIHSYGYKSETTYTAEVRDGTKKKAKVKIKVIVPVSSLQITANGLGTYANPAVGADMLIPESGITTTYLSSGYSTKLAVAFGDEYGTSTNKKIKWEAQAGYMENGVFREDAALAGMFKFKNGKLKFANGFTTDMTMNKGVLVTATSTDGTQLKAQKFVVACKKTTFFKFVQAQQGGLLIFETDGTALEYDIQTDNPNVACPEYYDAGLSQNGNILVAFAIYSPKGNLGNVTFTITCKDGSNKKFKQAFSLR